MVRGDEDPVVDEGVEGGLDAVLKKGEVWDGDEEGWGKGG